ncbi:hypothetical protein DFH06DRAFT_1337865 [Mycena polygramma]|nr:hypothetical protein DFH06DRAFT_1337865 [Mycena polygramma]
MSQVTHTAAFSIESTSVPLAATSVATSFPGPSLLRRLGAWFGLVTAGPPTPAPPTTPQSSGPWIAGLVYTVVPPQPLGPAPHDDGELWYGIQKGKFVGVTQDHSLALTAVTSISNNQMKLYKSQLLALEAFNAGLDAGRVEVRPY